MTNTTPPTTHQANIDAALFHCAAVQARAANQNGLQGQHLRPTSRRPLAPFKYDSRDLAAVLATSGVLP